MEKLAVSVSEAAKMLGINRSAAYDAVYKGNIPSVRLVERRILIPMAGLKKLIHQELDLGVDESESEDSKKPDHNLAFRKAKFLVTVEKFDE